MADFLAAAFDMAALIEDLFFDVAAFAAFEMTFLVATTARLADVLIAFLAEALFADAFFAVILMSAAGALGRMGSVLGRPTMMGIANEPSLRITKHGCRPDIALSVDVSHPARRNPKPLRRSCPSVLYVLEADLPSEIPTGVTTTGTSSTSSHSPGANGTVSK